MQIYTIMSWIILKIFMILKASEMGFEITFIVASSAVMVIIVAFGLKIWEGLFFGGGDLNYF